MGAVRVKRAWQGLVISIAIALLAVTGVAQAAASPASIRLTQSGSFVLAAGSNFTPGESLNVVAKINGGSVTRPQIAGKNGEFTLGFAPPAGYSGPLVVTAGTARGAMQFTAKTTASLPGQVLNLKSWKLTLPVGQGTGDGCKPQEILQPKLNSFTNEWFKVNKTGDGVVFRANVNGCTTSNSGYPRSELREMLPDGSNEAAWSIASGTHTMQIRQAVTHLPVVKPETVVAQIHGGDDDVLAVIADGKGGTNGGPAICFRNGDARAGCLDANYKLGNPYDLKIVASNGKIDIYYNGLLKGSFTSSAAECYFKVGNYTQSNLSKGDQASAYGETVLYGVKVAHA